MEVPWKTKPSILSVEGTTYAATMGFCIRFLNSTLSVPAGNASGAPDSVEIARAAVGIIAQGDWAQTAQVLGTMAFMYFHSRWFISVRAEVKKNANA